MPKETSEQIDAAAAEWAARLDRGPLSSEEEARLEAWMACDARRQGAFMRMRALSLYSERAAALGPQYDPDLFTDAEPQPIMTRRRILWAGSAAAAATVLAGIGLGSFNRGQDFETRRGEVRLIALEDGSVMTLNTASRVHVRYTGGRRSIALLEGEALFDVAKDRTRPFVVTTDGTSVMAVGTSFMVRHLAGDPMQVLVREGVVEVAPSSAIKPVRLAANMRLVSDALRERTWTDTLSAADVTKELAWRDGRIAFDGESLDEAAAAFARYSDMRIVVDPAVRHEEITGLFNINDPVTFARAAAASLELKVEVAYEEVRIHP